jgi:peptidoglycan/LPS O-acetylase OafA/YrhL
MSVALKYRSDIDGLRALAVLGVVIYHAFPLVLPGGFSGVDIFFVISGYLISGILYKGHREGGFSFGEFYARRIRRLFPALITMLVAVMGYGWVVMLPDEFSQVGKHVAAGGVFLQNVVYWKESGYFDVAANLKPLLHMWSLAVEEQFYIFFPLLLVVLWKRPRVLVPVMGVMLVVSFVVNVVMSVQNGASDFFLTPYRAWEFLGGSLLAWWHYDRGHEEEVPAYREVMSWVGTGLLVGGMVLLGKDQAYPGWRALMPVAGTLLVMEAGRGAWVNRRVLSHPAVVWVGLISYPLYLFHWPALSFVHIVKGENPKEGYVWAALGVALVLTLVTYYLVERPLRHRRSRWVLPVLIAAFLACALTGSLIWRQTIQARIPEEVRKRAAALSDKDFFEGADCDYKTIGRFSVGKGMKKTLFIGDSNMEQYLPRFVFLHRKGPMNSRSAVFIVQPGTLPVRGFYSTQRPLGKQLIPTVENELRSDGTIDRVVMAALWNEYFLNPVAGNLIEGAACSDPQAFSIFTKEFGDWIRHLRASGKRVVVVMTIPCGPEVDPGSCFQRTFLGFHSRPSASFRKLDFSRRNDALSLKLKKVALENGAEIVDPLDFLCDERGICIAEDQEGVPIRYDPFHLRPGYVREQVKYLDFTVEP